MVRFFAYLSRMRLIRRWGLMRNTQPENDLEHAAQAAMIAHGLALHAQTRYGRAIDPEHILALALYHDAAEVITGDLPTPIKHHNPAIKQAMRSMEALAVSQLEEMLPEDQRSLYHPYLAGDGDAYARQLVKAADRICAYVKCVAEEQAGNQEFALAKRTIEASIRAIPLEEVQTFFDEITPAFALSLDELQDPES